MMSDRGKTSSPVAARSLGRMRRGWNNVVYGGEVVERGSCTLQACTLGVMVKEKWRAISGMDECVNESEE